MPLDNRGPLLRFVAGFGRWLRRRPRRMVILVVLVAGGLAFPFVGGGLAARTAARKIEERLGMPVQIGRGWAGLTGITFSDLRVGAVGAGAGPLVSAQQVKVPYLAALGRGVVTVAGLGVDARRGGPQDNVNAVMAALRRSKSDAPAGAGAAPAARRLPGVSLADGRIRLRDAGSGLSVEIEKVSGSFLPDDRVEITLDKIEGLLALGSSGKGPRFGATKVTVSGPLAGARPRGFPTAAVEGGYASPLPTLSLTGIRGKVEPVVAAGADPATARELKVNLDGSYGGARETLWTAQGALDPRASEGQVALRAERFTLSEIAEVLPKTVLSPEATTVNGALDVSWAEGAVRFGGDLKVAGLSLHHPGLASDPLRDMDLELAVQGTAFPDRRRVALDKLAGRVGKLAGKVSGFVELAPGAFTFHDGSKLGFLPRIELALDVPKLPCAQALGSLPAAFVPKLQGFELTGAFGAEISTRVDYADLEALELHGKIGIDGCKVTKAPPGVKAVLSGDSIVHTVEIPPAPSTVARGAAGARGPAAARGDNEELEFIVGPENPDFVPYDKISPHLISSILTTEDNGFFKHRGWVSSEFKNALRRNLQRGGFRGGASSITMQMVKNVLLGQEKTLSRKLQELFLVWYLEKEVPKERILELYFNAIEFGPRIYGIGLAARHYFAKPAAELTPLEGAFFSSILPSPKRRYIQYCHGTLHPPWDKYVRRILAKAHERGRVSDEDFAAAAEQKVVFDRKDNFSERQCLDWVKKITVKPEPEAPPDIDAALDGDPVTDGRDRGRGGAGKGGKRGAVGKAKKRLSPEPRLVKTAAQ